MNEHRWKKWRSWIEKSRDDLSTLVDDKAVFTEFWKVVQQNQIWINSHEGGLFTDFIWRSYAASAIMGIRRHLKRGDRSISLRSLLDEIWEDADQVTYDFYLSVLPPKETVPNWRKVTFKNLSEDGKTVSRCIICEDINQTKEINRRIEEIADRLIAHLDPRGTERNVTDAELANVIDNFNTIICKYDTFLSGEGRVTLESTVPGGWAKTFQYPFVKPA